MKEKIKLIVGLTMLLPAISCAAIALGGIGLAGGGYGYYKYKQIDIEQHKAYDKYRQQVEIINLERIKRGLSPIVPATFDDWRKK